VSQSSSGGSACSTGRIAKLLPLDTRTGKKSRHDLLAMQAECARDHDANGGGLEAPVGKAMKLACMRTLDEPE
jgi:hypothetical protein